AQFNLGVILGEQGDTEGEIAAYRNITREDSRERYAKAQVNLGVALGEQGDTEGEIATYRNIIREDSHEQYAKAQLYLGITLGEKGDTEGAIAAYRNITREDSPETYAKAQLSLGMILEARGDTEGAIAACRNVTREDSPEQYAKAQLYLGIILGKQGDTEGAISAYRNITREDLPELYAMAQFNLGVALQEQGKIEEAKQAFSNSRSVFYYQAESQLKILNCPPDSRSNLAAVYDAIESIIQTLFISSYGGIAGENPLKVAHYTRPSTAGKLIAGDSAKASPLRLSTVKGTNDPTEGKILYGYLHKSCGLLSGVLDVEQESDSQALAAFISCFTFNHDSLNQFRLYGKEDGLEASGVSLVFEKHFFSAADPFAIMTAASEREAIMTANNTIEDSRPERADKTTQEKLDKLPLYRCIYLDPQSGYVSIAHRDKVTFYAEAWYGKKTAAHQDICKEAEKRWKKYQNEINELAKKAKKDLSTLSKKIKAVAKDAENDVLQTLVFILQPLRYLVKHAAFQEEQECRMVYIIGDLLKDERIRTDWGAKQMYLEYAEPVRKSLDKIYLSPGAEPYADFFKRELPHLAKKGGIRRSQNPFRNK
ncbi:MAG: tetratricopeptide repeat protein, partial [Cardiobacterium hominis]